MAAAKTLEAEEQAAAGEEHAEHAEHGEGCKACAAGGDGHHEHEHKHEHKHEHGEGKDCAACKHEGAPRCKGVDLRACCMLRARGCVRCLCRACGCGFLGGSVQLA